MRLKMKSSSTNANKKTQTISVLLALTLALALALPAQAQLDPSVHVVLQNGIRTALIYVPPRDKGATQYVEHWVLFPNYVYPGNDPELKTTITLAREKYASEEDFFARVPWGPGFRYVRVDCLDTDQLPGR